MASEKDISFTFDPRQMLDGIKKISDGVGNMSKGVANGIMQAAGKIGLFAVAAKGVQAVMKNMPEIQKTLDMAGDIMMKNLVWPLRQAVMPLLQKLLIWVRDNRENFVKLGQVLVNGFKAATIILKTFFDLIKTVIEKAGVTKLFNDIFGNVEKTFNMILFHVTVIMKMIGTAIEPFASLIGKVLGGLGSVFGGFVSAFKEHLGPILGKVNEVGKAFEKIGDAIVKMLGGSEGLRKIGETLANFFGKGIEVVISAVAAAINLLASAIEWLGKQEWFTAFIKGIGDALKAISDFMTGPVAQSIERMLNFAGGKGFVTNQELASGQELAAKRKSTMGQWTKEKEGWKYTQYWGDGSYQVWSHGLNDAEKAAQEKQGRINLPWTQVQDALITSAGQVVKFDPADNILAMKDLSKITGRPSHISIGGINITVTEGNARQAGMNFGEGLYDQLQAAFNRELELRGA